jgi:hypothetical protein
MRKKHISSKAILVFCLFIFLNSIAYAHTSSISNGKSILSTVPEPAVAGRLNKISISLLDENNDPIRELDTVHERKLHVFVIHEDLQTFAHIHPEDFPQGFEYGMYGTYNLLYEFPKDGRYLIGVDYTTNGQTYLESFYPIVVGSGTGAFNAAPLSRVYEKDGYRIELKLPKMIQVGNGTEASLFIQKDGNNVTDIQMLLGSEAHVAIVKEDFSVFDHTHAYRPGHYIHIGNMTQRYSGPSIPLRLDFPSAGQYALFAQIQHENKTITANFLVDVDENEFTESQKMGKIWLIVLSIIGGVLIGILLYVFYVAAKLPPKA